MKPVTGPAMLAVAVAAAICLAPAAQARDPKGISDLQKAAEALQISNIMGRYAGYVIANRWNEIGEMFALDDPDVHQNVPFAMSGPALRTYFSSRQAEKLGDGVLHQHAFMSPIIEVAGDDQTAKGVWDSPGIDTGAGNSMANWAWVRYAVDFKKIHGEWKIWHLSVLPVWRAAYGEEWSKMVSKDSAGKMTGGGVSAAGAGAPAGGPPAPGGAGPGGAGGPPPGAGPRGGAPGGATATKWRYNGVGETPLLPAQLPKPYYSFDPKDAY
ncbi:MAG TPA: nuclear transport factor 2 family protein [Steroidobacteraceae bacterium]|nr:nuclear transport factor 2 family protein [Steroidobacteraceae bacterium]